MLGAGEVNLTADDRARRVRNVNVDEHLLEALGLQAAQGRLFGRGETDRTDPQAALPPVAILSHELWQTAFGGQPIVGKMVEVNSRRREVIGIMPPGADVMDIRPEIWLPLGLNPSNPGNRRGHILRVIGRLKDDVTPEAARTELKTLNEQWGERVGVTDHMFAPMPTDAAARASNPDAGHMLQMVPLHRSDRRRCQPGDLDAAGRRRVGAADRLRQSGEPPAGACGNTPREFAVRTALGASRRRLLRQFIAEGALLSIAGGALALWLARVGLRHVTQAYPAALPRSTEVSVDLPVLLFACGVAMATSLFFGLAQLRHIGVKGLAVALTEAGTKGASGRDTPSRAPQPGGGRSRIGGDSRDRRGSAHPHGLQPRERRRGIQQVAPGDVLDHLAGATYPGVVIRVQTFQRLLDALRAVPGVEAATAMSGCRRIGRRRQEQYTCRQRHGVRQRGRSTSLTTIST